MGDRILGKRSNACKCTVVGGKSIKVSSGTVYGAPGL